MAMRWNQTIREKIEPSIIYNSWHNTGLISESHTSISKSLSNQTNEQELIEIRLLQIKLHSRINE